MFYKIDTLLLIGIIVLAVFLIALLVFFLVLRKKKRTKENELDSYYLTILKAVGEIENVLDVSSTSSRLSFVLKDYSKVDEELLKSIKITGIVKSSKKITLVIGTLALTYENKIKALLENK